MHSLIESVNVLTNNKVLLPTMTTAEVSVYAVRTEVLCRY